MPSSAHHKHWTLLAVCLGTFMLLLDVTIVTVALPVIQTSLDAGFGDIQWTIDAYALALAALLLPTGSLADLYGRRRAFALGLAVFTAGSLLCGIAQAPMMLVAFRALQGIGGAAVFATSLALLAQTFQGRERGMALGAWGAVAGVSTALGPVLGGLLTSGLGWRWIFLVNVPLGAFAIAVTLKRVQESPRQPRRVDVAGFAVFTLGLLGLVHGLIRASEHGWADDLVWISLAVGGVLLAAFPALERRVREPMFDLTLFRKPTFVGGAVAAFAMNGSLFAMFLYLVIYLQEVLGFSALESGVRALLITGATFATAIPAGRLSARVPVRGLIGAGLLLVGAGLLLMRGLDGDSSWTHLIPGFIVAGFGSGLVNPSLAATAVGVVAPRQAGMASGINTTFRQVGFATSTAALGSIVAMRLDGAPAAARPEAYVAALDDLLLVAAALAVVGAVAAFVLIRARDFVGAEAPAAAAAPVPARA